MTVDMAREATGEPTAWPVGRHLAPRIAPKFAVFEGDGRGHDRVSRLHIMAPPLPTRVRRMLETTEPSVAPNDTLHRYSTLVDRIRPLSGHESVLVIDAARSPLTCLPFQSESLPALVVSDLQDAAPDVLDVALAELARVAMRFVFVAVETGDRDPWASTIPDRGRAWWEAKFFAAGFGKHTLSRHLVPYDALEHEGPEVVMAFERL